jgi:hypothetical protein
MNKTRLLLAMGWCLTGLLALRMVLRSQPASVAATIETIRTRCEMPAGTVVFVVTGEEP